MMKRKDDLDLPREAIIDFCNRWEVKEFSIFGSILRDDFGPQSDVDVLLSFSKDSKWGLFELVDMKEELESIFGREVDIVEKEGMKNPFRMNAILQNRKVIYAAAA
ncbi:MAG: nucleotidyltransferase family protein [Candidatus Omnitrophota bacterium]